MEISEGIHFIKHPFTEDSLSSEFTGVTIVLNEEIGIIDTGFPSTPQKYIFPYLKKIGFNPERISLVVNTHCHGDHIGGNLTIQKLTGARIAAHKLEVRWIKSPELQYEELWGRYPQYFPIDEEKKRRFLESVGSGLRIDVELEEGNVIKLGDRRFKVIHTPGHSKGSICLYDEDNKLLVSGDSIQGNGTKGQKIAMVTDVSGYLKSMEKLKQLKIDSLIMDHAYKPFLKAILDRIEGKRMIHESIMLIHKYQKRIEDILESSTRYMDLREITRDLCKEFGDGGLTIQAMFTADSILQKLCAEGKVDKNIYGNKIFYRKI